MAGDEMRTEQRLEALEQRAQVAASRCATCDELDRMVYIRWPDEPGPPDECPACGKPQEPGTVIRWPESFG